MAATPQTQAIQIANQIIAIGGQLMALYTQMVVLDQAWTDNVVGSTLNAMGTVVLNSDGSTGASDATPNNAHPLDPTKYPTLQRSLSSNQIAGLKTVLDNIVTYVNGGAVTATPGARQTLNSVVGG